LGIPLFNNSALGGLKSGEIALEFSGRTAVTCVFKTSSCEKGSKVARYASFSTISLLGYEKLAATLALGIFHVGNVVESRKAVLVSADFKVFIVEADNKFLANSSPCFESM